MPDQQPRLGPWLRHQARQEETPPRERARELLVAGGAAVGGLVLLVAVLVAFVRFPFPTIGVLVAVWGIGYAVYRVKKERAELQERLLRTRLDEDARRR
ncbi:MAG TPA: hypothetical protein VGA02_10595 [Gemmatimonadales bacterium]|jgi:hypothetical protein